MLIKFPANLRFLFDSTVEILTCAGNDSCVIAFAYQVLPKGERVKIMQTYAGDVVKALKALHDMSCKRLTEFSTYCGHDLYHEHLAQCNIAVPMQPEIPLGSNNIEVSEDSNVLIDMPLPEEELEKGESEICEAEHGHTDVEKGTKTPTLVGFDNIGCGTKMDTRINQYCLTSRTEWKSDRNRLGGFSK